MGAKIAVKEIKHEGGCLQMCQKCQQTVERTRKLGSMSDVKIPASSDRVNRVTSFMESYMDKVNVQVQGLDAVLAFAHNREWALPSVCFHISCLIVFVVISLS